MRANMRKVLDLFLVGRPGQGDSKRTVHTDGTTMWSYSMPIATRIKSGKIQIAPVEQAPTRTTRSQIRALHDALHAGEFLDTKVEIKRLAPTQRMGAPVGGSR